MRKQRGYLILNTDPSTWLINESGRDFENLQALGGHECFLTLSIPNYHIDASWYTRSSVNANAMYMHSPQSQRKV